MSEWKLLRLGEHAETFAGGTPDRDNPKYFGGSIPWVKSTEVNLGRIKKTEEFLTEEGFRSSAAKWIPPETVLIALYGATAAQIAYLEIAATANQAVLAIRPNEDLDSLFLFYALTSAKQQILFQAQGSGQPNLNKQIIDRLIISAPSLPQQYRIAEILSTLDETIAQTESLIAKMQQVKAGLMHDLFTRGVTPDGHLRPTRDQAPDLYKESPLGWIPKEWEVSFIESLLDRIIDYRGKTPTKTEEGIPLITAKNVRMGYIDPEPREFIAEKEYPIWMTRGIPVHTDIVFTTEAPLGNVAQIGTSEKVAFAQRVIILQPSSRIFSDFLKHVLMGDSFQRSVFKLSSGTTALGVKQSEFRKVMIAYPCLIEEQRNISDRLDALDNYVANETDKMKKLLHQKNGLMHDLLTGRVRVKIKKTEAVTS